MTPAANLNLLPVSMTSAANLLPILLVILDTGVNDTGSKFAVGVTDTGGILQFATGINDTGINRHRWQIMGTLSDC
jgi:hypothetical protein